MAEERIMGSVEIAVIEFPGSEFKGEIVPALAELVDNGIVEILDLIVVAKSDDGDVVALEVTEVEGLFDDLDGEVTGLLSDEDIEIAADLLEPGTTAALIVWENTWARRLTAAVLDSGGRLVAHDRIDAETVAEALATA